MCRFLKKTMDYKWVKLSKSGRLKKCELNIPSCRVFYGLSEKYKYIQFGPTELKLWPFKTLLPSKMHCTYVRVLTNLLLFSLFPIKLRLLPLLLSFLLFSLLFLSFITPYSFLPLLLCLAPPGGQGTTVQSLADNHCTL